MGFFFTIMLLALFVHGAHSYHAYRKHEESGNALIDATVDSIRYGFIMYTVSIAILIVVVLLGAYFHWFSA